MTALAQTKVTATGRSKEVEEDFKIVTGITRKRVIYCNELLKTIFTSPITIPKLALSLRV